MSDDSDYDMSEDVSDPSDDDDYSENFSPAPQAAKQVTWSARPAWSQMHPITHAHTLVIVD